MCTPWSKYQRFHPLGLPLPPYLMTCVLTTVVDKICLLQCTVLPDNLAEQPLGCPGELCHGALAQRTDKKNVSKSPQVVMCLALWETLKVMGWCCCKICKKVSWKTWWQAWCPMSLCFVARQVKRFSALGAVVHTFWQGTLTEGIVTSGLTASSESSKYTEKHTSLALFVLRIY